MFRCQGLLTSMPIVLLTHGFYYRWTCAKELPVVQLVVSRDGDLIKLFLEGVGAVVQRTGGPWPSSFGPQCTFYWGTAVNSVKHDWSLFIFQCFELWTHVSQHWPVSFVLIELPFYGNGKSYIFSVLINTVCVVTYCECGLWCVSVCVHMCICIYHTAGLSCCCLVAKQQV